MPVRDVSYLLDPAWDEFQLLAHGGLVYAQQGLDVPTIDVTHFCERYSITESITDVARVFDFTLDVGDLLDAWRVQPGSDMQLWGNAIDRNTGGARNGALLFSGKVYTAGRQETAGASKRTYRAYDFLTLLARTEDTLVFTNSKMSDIVVWICALYGIPTGTIVDTEVPVGQIIEGPGISVAQVIQEAAQRTLKKSGRGFFVRCTDDNSALELLELGSTGVQWDLGDGAQSALISYDEEDSFEDGRTQVDLVTEQTDGSQRFSIVGTRFDAADPFALTFGVLKHTISPDNTTNAPTNDEQLDAEYALRNRLIRKASTRNIILPGARQGDRVVFHLPDGSLPAAYISTVMTEHTEAEPVQTLELIFDALGAVA